MLTLSHSLTLAHECALQHLTLCCTPWFEYVPSAANISDLPSRGRLAATIRLEPLVEATVAPSLAPPTLCTKMLRNSIMK